jgi:nucleotide-binding universal stress UspA family protein
VNSLIFLLIAIAVLVILYLLARSRRARPVPIAVPQAAESARESVGALRTILVPTAGTEYSERAVELACRIGEAHRATIHLLFVLVVPRSLPMGTPLPEEETRAKNALSRAESIVQSHGLEHTVAVERSRNAGEGIIQRAKTRSPDLIVVGMRPSYGADETLLGRTTDRLLRDAPCEVIVDKLPSE